MKLKCTCEKCIIFQPNILENNNENEQIGYEIYSLDNMNLNI